MSSKRGQFYLIAAVIIIVIIFGLVSSKNITTTEAKPVRFYDLSQDYGAETSKVIDYGTYNKFSPAVNISEKIQNISAVYAQYGKEKGINFNLTVVYGNTTSHSLINVTSVSSNIMLGTTSTSRSGYDIIDVGTQSSYNTLPQETVVIHVAGIRYSFRMRSQDNFYFIIQTTNKGESNVVVKDS